MPRSPVSAAATASPAVAASPAGPAVRVRPDAVNPACFKFGLALTDVCEQSGADVPLAIVACVALLDAHGLTEEGLFRVPGASNEVDEIKTALERGRHPGVGAARPPNPEAVATCLKLYLRGLADPVVPRSMYAEFVRIGALRDAAARVADLKTACATLPVAHRAVLRVLLPFLLRVARHAAVNRMTVANLAVVFGPTLLAAPGGDVAAMLRDSTAVTVVMTSLIENADVLFPDSAPPPAVQGAALSPVVDVEAGSGLLDDLDDDDDDDDDDDSTCAEIERVCARFDYAARSDTELAFKARDVLIIYKHKGPDWALGSTVADPAVRKFIAKPYVGPLNESMS